MSPSRLSLREWFRRKAATVIGYFRNMTRNDYLDEMLGMDADTIDIIQLGTDDFARWHPDDFPGGMNPGIQINGDLQMQGVDRAPPWWLPPWTPNHYVLAFPTGTLTWTPHPQPNPPILYPQNPWPAIPLAGGDPLRGVIPQWTPYTWPPLDRHHHAPIYLSPYIIPNPNNAHLPQINWNVTRHPSTARLLTENNVAVELDGVWGHPLTDSGAHIVMVACDVGHMSTPWGPVTVDRAAAGQGGAVTVRDLFDAIYRYFRVPLTDTEVWYMCGLHPSNYRRLVDAYGARCQWENGGLEGRERHRVFRRADVLGDRKYWWGVWISAAQGGTWWLNLGLVNPARRVPD